MNFPDATTLSNRKRLDGLLDRQSQWPLVLPIPDVDELSLVFEVAMRAPDHSNLKPWRFITVRNPATHELGEVFAAAALKRNAQDLGKASRSQATAAPMLIAVGARISVSTKVPEIEQLLSVAAATMNILNALHILGYGAYWASGENTYDSHVRRALGLGGDDERLLGFIYVGTPSKPARRKVRPSAAEFVTDWTGPAPSSAVSLD
ncbi:nitroreductase [Pseudomonas fluorescens]|uniref:nitroreductase family protein n=1 Tax=Pseudomonas fluorescens TaxID=294 RepID=UPI002ACA66A1|nr:nitroreductase [Pseudomonas fluorescens]MDZ5431397.1 nitroreductase [Pseudomonas fluorescens]